MPIAKDPAFLFYPGDASEDTQFMNRLERGCYFDLLKAQKKFRRFTLDQIKKVLGRDFDSCWPSIELVLKEEDDQYFIEWVEEKIIERQKFSESRRKNRQSKSLDKDMIETKDNCLEHMVIEDEDENKVVVDDLKGVQGETFENKFDRAFDEWTLEGFKINFPLLDISSELNHFRLKCNSAKGEYHSRDPDGLRLGFLKQLEHSPNKKQNGKLKQLHDLK